MKKSSKIIIIVLSVVLVLGAIVGTLLFLFFKTDVLKSNNEVFFKYLSQNVEKIEDITNPKIIENYTNLNNREKYEMRTTLNVEYSEGGEMSNPFNEVTATALTQKDVGYNYSDFKLLFGDQNVIELEGVQEDSLVGIRFTNLLSKFVSIDLDKELQLVDGDSNEEYVNNLEDSTNETKQIIKDLLSKENIEELKNKYFNVIVNTLKMSNFSKQSNSIITVNSEQKKVDIYTAEISSNNMQNLVLEILRDISSEEKFTNLYEKYPALQKHIENLIRTAEVTEMPTTKVMVYKKGNESIGLEIDYGTKRCVIYVDSKTNTTQLQYNVLNSEKEISIAVNTAKTTVGDEENYTTHVKYTNGDEVKEYNISTGISNSKMDYNVEYKNGIKKINVNLTNNIYDEISEKMELNSDNNLVLNDLDATSVSNTIGVLVTQVPGLLKTRYDWLLAKVNSTELFAKISKNISEFFKYTGNEIIIDQSSGVNEEQIQLEKNQFNAKFEFYIGTGKSYDDVKQLLEVVKDNLKDVELTMVETATSGSKGKLNIKLNIEKDTTNNELVESLLTKIEEKKKYDISMSYNSNSNLIDTIVIQEK